MQESSNTFAKSGKQTLYATSNQEYGSGTIINDLVWAQDGTRPEKFDLKKETVPTYTEIVGAMNDFKKAERLIKNKVIKDTLEKDGIPPEQQFKKTS